MISSIALRPFWIGFYLINLTYHLPGIVGSNDIKGSINIQNQSYQTGDIILGGLFDIHDLYDPDSNRCSSVNTRGLQYAQAMIYAIQSINNNPHLLPNIQLGYDLMDTCSSSQLALSYAIQYAQPSSKKDQECCTTSEKDKSQGDDRNTTQPCIVIGARTSEQSISVATLFNQYHLAQVSYASTSRILSNRVRFGTFFRTVPSDINQAKVFVDILSYFDWRYVAAIAADDIYGQFLINSLTALATQQGICIPIQRRFSTTKPTADIKDIIFSLLGHPELRVIILICSEYQAIQFLRQAQKYNLTGRTFIASDGWGDSPQLNDISHDVVGGALGVVLDQGLLTDFQSYLEKLDLCNPSRQDRSWWVNYWHQQLHIAHNISVKDCYKKQNWLKNNSQVLQSFLADGKSGYVIDSVFAAAHAIHQALQCDDIECRLDLSLTDLRHQIIHRLQNITFDGVTNPSFQFDRYGNSRGIYTIINLQPQLNGYNFVPVGLWNDSDISGQELFMLHDTNHHIVWNNLNNSQIPESRCQNDCPPGTYISFRTSHHSCCWDCFPCPSNTVSNVSNSPVCYSCPWGTIANDQLSQCQNVEVTYLEINDPIVITLLTIVSLCATITLTVWICMIVYRRTPIVRAAHRLLTHILLFGIMFAYIIPILLILPLTSTICSLALLLFSFSCTCVLACIMAKTQLMLGLFNVRNPSAVRHSLLYKSCGQFIIVSVLIIIVVATVGITLLLYPVTVGKYVTTDNQVYTYCRATTKTPFIVLLSGLFIGNIICIGLAYRARKLPSNFNEAKHIFITCLAMCMTLLYLVPFYFATTGLASTAAIAFGITGFAIVVVLCLYSYKIYLIIIRPDLNTRRSTRRTVSRYSFTQKSIK